jgi:hypothetical protein
MLPVWTHRHAPSNGEVALEINDRSHPMHRDAVGALQSMRLRRALLVLLSVIGLSLPEMIILRKVLKTQLIMSFAGVVALGILVVGYVFNMLM